MNMNYMLIKLITYCKKFEFMLSWVYNSGQVQDVILYGLLHFVHLLIELSLQVLHLISQSNIKL